MLVTININAMKIWRKLLRKTSRSPSVLILFTELMKTTVQYLRNY